MSSFCVSGGRFPQRTGEAGGGQHSLIYRSIQLVHKAVWGPDDQRDYQGESDLMWVPRFLAKDARLPKRGCQDDVAGVREAEYCAEGVREKALLAGSSLGTASPHGGSVSQAASPSHLPTLH